MTLRKTKMNLNKVTVYRMPYREVRLDNSIERNKREAFDLLQDIEIATQLRALIYDKDQPFETMRDAVIFNYGRNNLALGIELLILPESVDTEYFESICNALFESASTERSISLRTKSGYVTTPVNAYGFAMFYIYIDSVLRTVERSAYKEDKYLASLYIKLKNSLRELMHRSIEKTLKPFVGSTITTYKPDVNKKETVSDRTIYVVDSLTEGLSDKAIIDQFNAMEA